MGSYSNTLLSRTSQETRTLRISRKKRRNRRNDGQENYLHTNFYGVASIHHAKELAPTLKLAWDSTFGARLRTGPAKPCSGSQPHLKSGLVIGQGQVAGCSGLETEMDFGEVKIRR